MGEGQRPRKLKGLEEEHMNVGKSLTSIKIGPKNRATLLSGGKWNTERGKRL